MNVKILAALFVLLVAGVVGYVVLDSRQEAENSEQTAAAPEAPAPAPDAAKKPRAPAPETATSDDLPSFDLVRVEPSGEFVAAGHATADARVELVSADAVLGKSAVNASGEWAIVLDKPLGVGSHDLALRATDEGDASPRYGDHVAVVITGDGDTPLVAVTPQGKPSRIVQRPETPAEGGQQVAAAEPGAKTPEGAKPGAGKAAGEAADAGSAASTGAPSGEASGGGSAGQPGSGSPGDDAARSQDMAAAGSAPAGAGETGQAGSSGAPGGTAAGNAGEGDAGTSGATQDLAMAENGGGTSGAGASQAPGAGGGVPMPPEAPSWLPGHPGPVPMPREAPRGLRGQDTAAVDSKPGSAPEQPGETDLATAGRADGTTTAGGEASEGTGDGAGPSKEPAQEQELAMAEPQPRETPAGAGAGTAGSATTGAGTGDDRGHRQEERAT